MQLDPERRALQQQLWNRGVSLAAASLALGRNKAYLQQYLARGMPRVLSHQDSAKLGEMLDCDPGLLRHAEIPPPKPGKRRNRAGRTVAPDRPAAEAEASAGPCAPLGDFVPETEGWRIPGNMIRHEGGIEPGGLCILRLRGNSMEPWMREGDRLIVDTARRVPHTGELFVLRDGQDVVVKRVAHIHGSAPPRLRLIPIDPDHAPVIRLAEDVEPIGKVIWSVRRD